MYWQAYSLDRLNRQTEALTAVAQLLKSYPMSRWLNDARALELSMRQRAGQPVSPDTQNDDDLRLLAIQGLQQMDSEQAVPLLEKILQGYAVAAAERASALRPGAERVHARAAGDHQCRQGQCQPGSAAQGASVPRDERHGCESTGAQRHLWLGDRR